ncbi:MAG: hypothetical protein DRJ32_05385 [Thermoprotei archaeon]|nr:MAG: hypothetical protein B6U94_03285 [Thermofilum sp. ex4484_79]RLE59018.1 MAG: hypothetical protein DRJ32_05385 [Thermoprotei archaeon]HDD63677.1 GTP-binding protein [Thermoprotei archaeon]
MTKRLKVVILGPFNSGKTTFVKNLSDVKPITTDQPLSKPVKNKKTTTVAFDYGRKRIGGIIVHLYGTPGEDRFNFLREYFAKNSDALIFIVRDDDKQALENTVKIYREISKYRKPHVIIINRTGRGEITPEQLRLKLNLDNVPIYSTSVVNKGELESVFYRIVDTFTSIIR